MSEEESIRRGLSKLHVEELNDEELLKLENLKKTLLNEDEIRQFDDLYDAWKNERLESNISNLYGDSEKYTEFINFCI